MQPAGAFVDLVFHGLAFVPAAAGASADARAASLYWPPYVASVRADLPLGAWEPLEVDAGLLSLLFEPVTVAHAIALFADLHGSIAAFQRTARLGLCELGDGDVASVQALHALRRLPEQAVELFRASLLLCAREFELVHRERFEPFQREVARLIGPCLAGLEPVLQRLDLTGVRLSSTLGPRGRGLPSGVIVGVSSPPGGALPPPEPTLVMAVHERLVERVADTFVARGWQTDWSRVEAVAIALERDLTRGTRLEQAQHGWLAAIDTSGLAPVEGELAQVVDELRIALTRA